MSIVRLGLVMPEGLALAGSLSAHAPIPAKASSPTVLLPAS